MRETRDAISTSRRAPDDTIPLGAPIRVAPAPPWPRVALAGIGFDACTEAELIAYVMGALDMGAGGRIVTPNVDILRVIRRDAAARALVTGSDVIVADGMPLLWGARAAGTPLPARVPGSDLIWSLSAAAAERGRTIYLLGGDSGVPERAAEVLRARHPGLTVAGTDSPPFGFDKTAAGVAEAVANAAATKPDIIFVGLGFPRQERLMLALAAAMPGAWLLGCGASIPFVAGTLRRAPAWMQRLGIEWLHRLASEPRRLFVRYVWHDLPYAARLLAGSLRTRLRRRGR